MTESDRWEVVCIISQVLSDQPGGQGDVDTAIAVTDALVEKGWLP